MTGARGQATIKLPSGRDARLLFTNRAIAEVEAALGRSIIALLSDFQTGDAGMREAATLLRYGMEAERRDAGSGGRPISENDAFEVMDQVGFATVMVASMESVAFVLGYGAEEEDEDPN